MEGCSNRAVVLISIAAICAASVAFADSGEGKFRRRDRRIAGQYIVVFNDDRSDSGLLAGELVRRSKGKLRHRFNKAMKGFAGEMTEAMALALSSDPRVAFVEEDSMMNADQTQTGATWGLDRIDQSMLPLNSSYNYFSNGTGVNVYVIDTGIRITHRDFGGRAAVAFDSVKDGWNGLDCDGHGTHVAGTIGGNLYGVAKGVKLHSVRVLDCDGSGATSGVIAGVDWVTANHQGPSVANMSLGGGTSTALDQAVRRSIASGVVYAVAAGNENANACNGSPARVADAITVGATTKTDIRASYSNYGSCVDIFAPGSSITSAWGSGDTATATISGTSMATPHVAGVAALYLQQYPAATPTAVSLALMSTSVTGRLTSLGSGSPNRMLSSLVPGNVASISQIPSPCTGCAPTMETLYGTGDYRFEPAGSYYYTSVSGTHQAWLSSPAGASFDLIVYRWSGSEWIQLGATSGSAAMKWLSVSDSGGYYLWKVSATSGSGMYQFWLQKP